MKQLVFDISDATSIADSDTVGAVIRGTRGGNFEQVNSQQINSLEWLNVAAAMFDGSGNAISSTGGSLDVQTELGKAEDSAHVSGDIGAMALAVRSDAGGSLVDTDGDYTPLQVDATGALRVNASVNVDSNSDYAEDSAHGSGDTGEFVLAVRNDTLGSLVDTDGDYAPLQVDANGALYTYISGSDPLTVNDAALADTAIATAANALGVADTPEDLVASPLANRKYLWVHNDSNKNLFIGASGVSAADGFPVSPGQTLMMRAGASIDIEFVGQSGATPTARTMEIS